MKNKIKEFIYTTSIWNKHYKNKRELRYWKDNIQQMVKWYDGKASFRGFAYPTEEQKEKRFSLTTNAVMTYVTFETEKASYLADLSLREDSFSGLTVGDLGSGPFPTLLVFKGCERYCIDHLINDYANLGYPIDEYKNEITFLHSKLEHIECGDNFFDALISRNALDHTDHFDLVAEEIKRVLKPDGKLVIQVHYHKPTQTETQQLNDDIILRALDSIGMKKISSLKDAWGFKGGETVVWSNM